MDIVLRDFFKIDVQGFKKITLSTDFILRFGAKQIVSKGTKHEFHFLLLFIGTR